MTPSEHRACPAWLVGIEASPRAVCGLKKGRTAEFARKFSRDPKQAPKGAVAEAATNTKVSTSALRKGQFSFEMSKS